MNGACPIKSGTKGAKPCKTGPNPARRVALPYIAWSFIYLAYSLPAGEPVPANIWAMVQAIVFGTAFYHLYYVVVSLQWYTIFPWVLSAARKLGTRALWVATAVVTLLYLGMAAWLGRHLWAVGGVMTAIFGFLLADLMAQGPDPFARLVDIFRPGLVLYGLAGAALFLSVSTRIAHGGGQVLDWLLSLSRNSYAIYLAHPLALFLVELFVLSRLQWHHPLVTLPLVALGVLIPHGLALLLKATPLAPLLLGQEAAVRRRALQASQTA